jgi:type IV secretion system protein VirB9
MKRITVSLIFAATTLFAADTKPTPLANVKIDAPRTVMVGERSITRIHICPLQITTLVLPEHELTRTSSVADTENWKLETTESKQASRYLNIHVKQPLTNETTLNVMTDHDSSYTFILDLNSGSCDSKVFIDADSALAKRIENTRPWLSPDDADRLRAQVEDARKGVAAANASVQSKVDDFRSKYPSKLRFDYKYDQKMAEKLGVHSIYTDGKFLFVSASPTHPPSLYELKDGKPGLIAFDFKDGLYTAPVIDVGYLAIGGTGDGKHQQKLSFRREVEAN